MPGRTIQLGPVATVDEINAAIITLSEEGGGRVRLARYARYAGLTSSIEMYDNVELDGNWATLYQSPDAVFRMVVNENVTDGNSGIVVRHLTIDGGRLNSSTPRPWYASTRYYRGTEVMVQALGAIYVCTVGGISGTAGPSGTTDGQADGTVVWDYVCPLWVPGSDQLYFTRCRDCTVDVRVRHSRNDGVIIEGSADIGGVNLCDDIRLRVQASDCNKAGVYLSSAFGVTGYVAAERTFEGLALAATRNSTLKVWARDNTYANGIGIGRDTQNCTLDVDVDGINTIVEHIDSAPATLHGHLYPGHFAVTVTPLTLGDLTFTYWVVARNAEGEVVGVSTAATTTQAGINIPPTINVQLDWSAVTGAATYDILRRVSGVPRLLDTQAGTTYVDTTDFAGSDSTEYDYTEAFTYYGFSDCTITGRVTRGAVVLRHCYGNVLEGLKVRRGGAANDVSSPHAIDLQGASGNTISGFHVAKTSGTGYSVALETYVEPTFGTTLQSNENTVEYGRTVAGPESTHAIVILDGCEDNVVRHNRADLPNLLLDASTVDEDNQ